MRTKGNKRSVRRRDPPPQAPRQQAPNTASSTTPSAFWTGRLCLEQKIYYSRTIAFLISSLIEIMLAFARSAVFLASHGSAQHQRYHLDCSSSPARSLNLRRFDQREAITIDPSCLLVDLRREASPFQDMVASLFQKCHST
jgi:hypothetical protein